MNLSVLSIMDDLERIVQYIVIDLDNFRLPFAPINNFIKNKIGMSINRIRDYAYGLINYFNWINLNDLDYLTITENQINTYILFLEHEPDKRTNNYKVLLKYSNISEINPKMKDAETLNKQISIVRTYYDYLLKADYVNSNPCPLVYRRNHRKENVGLLAYTHNRPRVISKINSNNKKTFDIEEFLNEEKISEKEPFTSCEIQKIVSLLKEPQERLLICMLFLGMRISEALGRRISDLKWSERKIPIIKRDDDPRDGKIKYDSMRNIEMRGVLYFNNLVEIMHASYTEYVDKTLRPSKQLNNRKYLFVKLRGNPDPLNYNAIHKRIIVNNLRKHMNNREITFHSFRHHFSTTSIALGKPIEEVQKMLGHSEISTTINHYYNPSLRFLKTLVSENIISEGEAEHRVRYLVEYKKKFCRK